LADGLFVELLSRSEGIGYQIYYQRFDYPLVKPTPEPGGVG
jgi:hypothetical protein